MSFDMSSTSSDYPSTDICQICEKPGHGMHHGIMTCRACAAFFRRSTVFRNTWKCRKNVGNCNVLMSSGNKPCKKCRLEKCFEMGMTLNNFQFHRDVFSTCDRSMGRIGIEDNAIIEIPQTIEKFVGRPHMIVRCEPSHGSKVENVLDVNHLINKTHRILSNTSFNVPDLSTLDNLVSGLRHVWNGGEGQDVKVYRKLGQIETIMLWECEFLGTAKCLNRIAEFQAIPDKMKMKLIMCVWYVWGFAQKLVLTAEYRSTNQCKEYDIMITNKAKLRNKNLKLDVSWCSKYNKDQLMYFLYGPEMNFINQFIDILSELQPTEHEKAFVILQSCLNFATRIIDSEMLPYVEKMQTTIYDEIHNYYVNTMKMPRYSGRLAKLVKCDRLLQSYFLERKKKRDISRTFEILILESSHPEMFENVG